jgi:Arc/MetJ-type ribon-helix-helix transcriptional regulator
MPIQYSQEQPPAKGPNVSAHLDTDTGSGMVWKQVANAGNEMADMGMKIAAKLQQASDQTEYNTIMRQYAEQEQAAHTQIATSLDPVANQAVLDKFKTDWQAPKASNPRVQQMVNGDLAMRLPNSYAMLNLANLKTQRDQIDVQDQVNENHFYASGDQKSFEALQDSRQTNGLQTKLETAVKKEAFSNMSAMTKAGIALANNKPLDAEAMLQASDPKTMTPELVGHYNALERTIRTAKEEQSQQTQSQLVADSYKASNLPANQQIQAFDAIHKQALSAPMTAAERREMLNWIDKMQNGKADAPDDAMVSDGWRSVYALNADSPKSQWDTARSSIAANLTKTGSKGVEQLKILDERKAAKEESNLKGAINGVGGDSDGEFVHEMHVKYGNQHLDSADVFPKVASDWATYQAAHPQSANKPMLTPKETEKLQTDIRILQIEYKIAHEDLEEDMSQKAQDKAALARVKLYAKQQELDDLTKPQPAPTNQLVNPQDKEGDTATNKTTGEKMMFHDGKWVQQ